MKRRQQRVIYLLSCWRHVAFLVPHGRRGAVAPGVHLQHRPSAAAQGGVVHCSESGSGVHMPTLASSGDPCARNCGRGNAARMQVCKLSSLRTPP